jgi:hypothetical protein
VVQARVELGALADRAGAEVAEDPLAAGLGLCNIRRGQPLNDVEDAVLAAALAEFVEARQTREAPGDRRRRGGPTGGELLGGAEMTDPGVAHSGGRANTRTQVEEQPGASMRARMWGSIARRGGAKRSCPPIGPAPTTLSGYLVGL